MPANIDLHRFEKRFVRRDGPGTWAQARIVRCADDFVILADLVAEVTRFLRGSCGNFRHGSPSAAFKELNWYVSRRFLQHLRRRSQRCHRIVADETA